MDCDEIDPHTGDAAAIVATVKRLAKPHNIGEDGNIVALPEGFSLHSLKPFEDERRGAPERREGTATHTTLDSFCAGVRHFADEDSAIFAEDTPSAPKLLAVFDYHRANQTIEGENIEGAPRFGRHRAVYNFPLSPEWVAWVNVGQRELSQRALCEFLEQHVIDVVDPAAIGEKTKQFVAQLGITLADPSQVLTIARGLEVKVDTKIVQAVNLSTGETEFTFEESHRDKSGAPVRIHRGFAVQLPVFREGAPYVLVVRLTYRKKDGELLFRLAIQQADRAFRDAFTEACTDAQRETGVPLFFGTPER